jgi:hypothetical protein
MDRPGCAVTSVPRRWPSPSFGELAGGAVFAGTAEGSWLQATSNRINRQTGAGRDAMHLRKILKMGISIQYNISVLFR